jgi:branched-chain amino acid transport system substrate-binding protein
MHPPTSPRRRRLLRYGAAAAASCWMWTRAADARTIVLGHTYPASGIFADTAAEMKAAIDAAALAANAAGGIAGRPVGIVSLDDGYEPERTLANAQRLAAQHGAVALIAPIGTPNLEALAPWAERTGTPLIGARTGADSQRTYRRQVFFNIASFGDEVRHVARHLDTIGVHRVAIGAMGNASGQEIVRHFLEAALERGITTVEVAGFHPAGKDAAVAARRLLEAKPGAVLLAGGGEGAVALTRALLDAGWSASALYALSLQQPQHLHRALGARCDGMVFTQVMPRLGDQRLPLSMQYRAALERVPGAHPTPFGLEGFLSMQIALRALQATAHNPTGPALAAVLDRMGSFDVGGFRLHYDTTTHHGTRYVDLGILNHGRVTR